MSLQHKSVKFKSYLLRGVSAATITIALGFSSSVYAAGDDADATTDVNTGATVTATDAGGLLNNDPADHAITIDSTAGAITLGTLATTDAVTFKDDIGGTRTATYTITTSGTNNAVTFAGDIEAEGDEIIVLNATNTTTVFTGDVTVATGSATLTLGAGTSTISTTFDTATAASNIIDMAINANAAGDTVTLQVTNTDGTVGNGMTFSQAIGGGSAATAIDSLSLGTATKATFSSTVRADAITSNTTQTTTFTGAVTANSFTGTGTGATTLTGGGTFGSLSAAGNVTSGTGALDINGTVAISGGDLVIGSGDATLSGAAITADNITLAAGNDITFDGTAAQTVTGLVDGGGAVTLTNTSGVTFANAIGATTPIGALTIG